MAGEGGLDPSLEFSTLFFLPKSNFLSDRGSNSKTLEQHFF